MTIAECIDEVMEAVQAATAGLGFEPPDDSGGDPVGLHYYRHQIPRSANDSRTDPFPYVIVRTTEGEASRDRRTLSGFDTVILIGVRKQDLESTAYLSAAELLQRLIIYFSEHPSTEHFFLSGNTIPWSLTGDEQDWPYAGGGILLHWEATPVNHFEEDDYA